MSEQRTGALSIERRDDGVAVVTMDVPGEPVNTLKADFAAEFERAFAELEGDDGVRAVVFTSGKDEGFVAGADIEMLDDAETASEAAELSRTGQRAMDRIAGFRAPVVAAIHGACLGGGLELALACRERVASDDRKTKLGLPEVQLGLLPGAGGTQRLPALIGAAQALDLMLTGKQVPAKKAYRMGLVDEVVPGAIAVDVAIERAKRLADDPRPRPGVMERLKDYLSKDHLEELGLERNPLGRKVLFDKARDGVLGKTHGNYPAPERILAVVRTGLEKGREAGLAAEAEAFGELVVSPEAKQLMGIYFATQALKKDRGTDAPAEPRPVAKVAMLGAGLMGSGISYVTAAIAGKRVRLKDKDHEGVGRGLKAVRELFTERVKRKRLTRREAEQQLARVSGTTTYAGFRDVDVVIEAVFEDLDLKHRIVREVEEAAGPEAIFASNTSSLPIGEIAAASERPEQVIGMHYFSPVHKMPLLEIITHERTAPWVTATCVALGKAQGKTVIVVRDGPGFYTSRILAPYMNEAAYTLAEGVPVEAIDRALVDFGYPVGPIVLLDEVGIDVGHKVGEIMRDAFGERMAPPEGQERLIEDGRLGRKNGRGFYLYEGEGKRSKQKKVDPSVYEVLGVEPKKELPAEEVAWRCTLQMVNEAARCFEEGILRSARDGDIGAIFGLGFPPFRGGPFRFVDAEGPAAIVERLRALEKTHGARFAPAELLVRMAEQGQTFYGEAGAEEVSPGQAASATA